jgi:hypothetical protein
MEQRRFFEAKGEESGEMPAQNTGDRRRLFSRNAFGLSRPSTQNHELLSIRHVCFGSRVDGALARTF